MTHGDSERWTHLVTLHSRVEQHLTEVLHRRCALGLREYRTLSHLTDAPEGELRMQELADAVGLDQSSASRLAGRLERAELAERCHCPGDRRGVFLGITKAGRERQAQAQPIYEAALSEALDEAASATDPALATLTRSLRTSA
ncbi:MarR family transcriptional regulator [Streptomyces durmitorensis]|uniref:MarR family transcriptional regulator n=1 Tax=Streptomyces durmitorensis TaxID=319947 RepID=A0ABY4PLC1_9ACTN|nr:MarR family transcriptional regulator [Streptomyces durmitorensis]UQT54109.1 MarR family transcriptional regulator [Streptomyces durmitorensis]